MAETMKVKLLLYIAALLALKTIARDSSIPAIGAIRVQTLAAT